MKYSYMSSKLSVGQLAGPFACITLTLICLSCLGSQKSPAQVEAIISSKARICFNSMSSTFQSECVYCDSRYYTSTLMACTGQPTLANNVSQAQAFCIATACLEVPVLNKADPFGISNNFVASYMNKLNLFRPSLMFGGLTRNNQDWSSASGPKHQKMFGWGSSHATNTDVTSTEQLLAMQHSSKKLLIPSALQYLRQEVVDRVSDYAPQKSKGGAETASGDTGSTAKTSGPKAGDSAEASDVATTAAATSETTAGTAIASAETEVPVAETTESETKPVMEYPDFNKMHAKIYANSFFNHDHHSGVQRNKFTWRPAGWPKYSLMSGNYPQQRQQLVMNQMSNLVQTLYGRLAEKRANWQTGKVPIVLGRKKRSLLPSFSLNLNKSKQKVQNNGTVTAQLNKSVNGTTSGNLAFVLNKPSTAFIWSNPLTKVFTKNTPNKNIQWQFGKGQPLPALPAAPPAAAGQLANPQVAPRPAVAMATSGLNQQPTARPLNMALNSNPSTFTPAMASTAPVMLAPLQQQQQQQQASPMGASLVAAPQIDNTAGSTLVAGSGAAGSFVVPADEAALGARG